MLIKTTEAGLDWTTSLYLDFSIQNKYLAPATRTHYLTIRYF